MKNGFNCFRTITQVLYSKYCSGKQKSRRSFGICCYICTNRTKYSGLNLNRYGVASPCRTICTVWGFVALS
ncbi:hypothetical protein EEE87_11160 [Neisseria gonorrhoeae]